MSNELLGTPIFVLLESKQRIGPNILSSDPKSGCMTIYGFSNKEPYDLFCKNSGKALTPYPLVPFYLKSEVADAGDQLKLVIIDASGPSDTMLHASTMALVLKSQELHDGHVLKTHQLQLDTDGNGYRIVPMVAA